MSKNRREKIAGEITGYRRAHSAHWKRNWLPSNSTFSNPDPGRNWADLHRRHAEIQKVLEGLYSQLAELSELLG